jgi:hypothetical protein
VILPNARRTKQHNILCAINEAQAAQLPSKMTVFLRAFMVLRRTAQDK